ncbi:MAG: U32 family peptidase [Clostridia bacterium]|nr:U32 family peptidase [Clostridia bacterium]
MIELLAPVGSQKSFYSAINNGANAVYLGLNDFSARKNAENFNSDNINYFVSYAHALGVKVYLTVNTVIKDDEFNDFLKTVAIAYSAGVDAFILQDVFLGKVLKECFDGIVLHLSTQGGVNELGGAEFALKEGFSRVILARETPLEEIRKITKIIETEVFVHGALCSCFSGHCYMSSFVGGNSGNRGLCKQPCRKEYSLESSKKSGEYAISLSDLCLVDELKELINAGVKSFKIEGRMRSPEYVGSAVRLYKKAIDGEKYDISEVKRTFNRGDYTKGYLYGVEKNIISDKVQNHLGEKVGRVIKVKGDIIFTDRNNLKGDAFKIISNGFEVGNAFCETDGKTLKFKGRAKVGDDIRITKDSSISNGDVTAKKKSLTVRVYLDEHNKLCLESDEIIVKSQEKIERAKNCPTSFDEIKLNLNKTDVYPFDISCEISLLKDMFIPKKVLNNLRAELYKQLFYKDVKPLKIPEYIIENKHCYECVYKAVILTDEFVKTDEGDAFVLHPVDYKDVDGIKEILENVNCDKFLFVPSFLPTDCKNAVEKLLPLFHGVYADGLSGIALSKKHGKKLICGTGLNAFNSIDLARLYGLGDCVASSVELANFERIAMQKSHLFTFGQIRLMELIYCPFGGDCKNCNRDKTFYSLTDKLGHKFKIRRYKIGKTCKFEVYNEQILLAKQEDYQFINLIGLDKNLYYEFKNGNFNAVKENCKITSGNLKRGVF